MKIIDKTPLQDAKGEISAVNRVQGTLKYGMTWFADMQAQKAVIAQLDRMIEKGYVLIRNFTLPNSEITIPIVLIGTGGVFVIMVSSVKGFFEAKGDQWNTVNNGKSQPASVNLLGRLSQLTRAFQKYLEINKIHLPAQVETVLIAADPGAHIESVRPVARVVMSDAIKQFGTSLLQARPVLRPDQIYDLADRIVEPRPRQTAEESAPPPMDDMPVMQSQAFVDDGEVRPFNPNDLGFAFTDDEQAPNASAGAQPVAHTPMPAQAQPAAPKKRKIMGMSTAQIALLAGMLLVECCVLIGFFYIISSSS
jgi:hypothetical protein